MSIPHNQDQGKALNTTQRFLDFFSNKGILGSVGEKAKNNFKSKNDPKTNSKPEYRLSNLYHFAIGHALKNVPDKKILFDSVENEVTKKMEWRRFLHLRSDAFSTIETELFKLIDNIRNLNAHFIHDFEQIRVETLEQQNIKLIPFLEQSFELAVILSIYRYESQKNLFSTNEQKVVALKTACKPEQIVEFIKATFYQSLYKKILKPNQEKLKVQKRELDNLLGIDKMKWIRHILFVPVTEDFDWELNYREEGNLLPPNLHRALKIKQGTYLSFEACLFMLSMFLYKNEAQKLVPKLRGFKKNGTAEDQRKINLFTCFSKKFKSQDIDSENTDLVKFRDLVQYLNKYPVAWNSVIDLKDFDFAQQLVSKLYDYEIENRYPKYIGDARFNLFVRQEIIGLLGTETYSPEERKEFEHHLYTDTAILKEEEDIKKYNAELKIKVSERKELESKIKACEGRIKKIEKEQNEREGTPYEEGGNNRLTQKLIRRRDNNQIIVSFGRNVDWFMEYAARFLAEEKYFGEQAKFKMYRFYTTQEQDAYIVKCSKDKSKLQKLKYHQGKLVHYINYDKHLADYPNWDLPFVVENNCIHVELDGSKVCLQRELMRYLLEFALFKSGEVKYKGEDLLRRYIKEVTAEREDAFARLDDSIDKTKLSKLLPKRLLHQYVPARQNNLPKHSSLELVRERALEAEKRFELLKEKNKGNELFHNKGLNFKLHFIRKAWQLMFFREMYDERKEIIAKKERQTMQKNATHEFGHHSSLNITRTDFNNFSKWMYAFDTVPSYKGYLRDLFDSKRFFKNADFKLLFEEGKSIEDFYKKTMKLYEEWLPTSAPHQGRFAKENYEKLLNCEVYINVSHFREFLVREGYLTPNAEGKFEVASFENRPHLVQEFYAAPNTSYKQLKEKTTENLNEVKKLSEKLLRAKHEDGLLYKLAFHYLQHDSKDLKAPVREVLSQDIVLDVHDGDTTRNYQMKVNFGKIDRFFELKNASKNKANSVFHNLRPYLERIERTSEKGKQFGKEIVKVQESFTTNGNLLELADLNQVNNHLINASVRFTEVQMALEEYYVWKHRQTITQANRIDLMEIETLKDFFSGENVPKVIRDKALHFNIPPEEMTYSEAIARLEKLFLGNEFSSVFNGYEAYERQKPIVQETLKTFLKKLHDQEFFNKKNFYEEKNQRIAALISEIRSKERFWDEKKLRKEAERRWKEEEAPVKRQKAIEMYLDFINRLIQNNRANTH